MNDRLRLVPISIATFLAICGMLQGEERKQETSSADGFFERLDTNQDGRVTLDEAPKQGKMLVEFLLRQSGKNVSDQLDRAEFRRLVRNPKVPANEKDPAGVIAAGDVRPAPDNCAACAMVLTAEFVFRRLDVDDDKFITVTEFMRSPGMQDKVKAREAVGRLDKSGDGKLSWKELETGYTARHANCEKSDPAATAANAEKIGPDGRGDGNRFAQVFILRSDQNGDGKISKEEFRGPAFGFNRLDKNSNGFIEANELGDLHQRRLNDPKSMKERLKSGDVPKPPKDKRPTGLDQTSGKK